MQLEAEEMKSNFREYTSNMDSPICPWCGYEVENTDDLPEIDASEFICPECGGQSELTTSVRYECYPIENIEEVTE